MIGNAAKFSRPQTPIRISGAVEDGRVVVSVRDQGPGIAEADLPHIFERFYRGRHTKNHVPGAGLGLFIAREIVRAHGGEIWAESTLGAGSTFHFSASTRAARGDPMSVGRILVVDDDPQIRRVMKMTLAGEGYEVADARSGEEAQEALRASALRPDAAGHEHAGHGWP